MAYISSNSADEMERIRAAERLKDSFSGNLTVKILSQDGDIVIDKEIISDYLGRIATSRSLMNVSIDNIKVNKNGQVILLSVRESYKKSK